jgi:hypothetical protein
MARTVLSDDELSGLVRKILGKGHASFIREWMSWIPDIRPIENLMRWENFKFKDLGYKDFKLNIPTFIEDPETNTVIQAHVQIWRPSKWFGKKECRKIFHLLLEHTRPRYDSSIAKNPEILKVNMADSNC